MHADAAAVGVSGGRVADHEADALGGLHPERREEEADAGRRGDADGPFQLKLCLQTFGGLVLGCIKMKFCK